MKPNNNSYSLIKKFFSKTRIFWLVAFLFILPIALASYFYTHNTFKKAIHKNHGTLVHPTVYISDLLLKNFQTDSKNKKPKWALVYVQRAVCQKQCEKRLYTLRQIHIALGKDSRRLQKIFYATEPFSKLQQKKLIGMGFKTIEGNKTTIYQLGKRLSYKNSLALPTNNDDLIILIDPRGYFVLFYPKKFKPKDILSDLRHLLKFSQIG